MQPDEVLVFGSSAIIEICGSVLRGYRLATSSNADAALSELVRQAPALVIADLDWSSEGPRVCEAAKAKSPTPATVLVTTNTPETVLPVLTVCDGVLLKPFAPNLLAARVGRLLRANASALRTHSGLVLQKLARQRAKSDHLLHRGQLARQGTNTEWPNSVCPHCRHRGVTSFDFISHRRSWYACPECRKVWIGQRQEDF